MIDENTNKFAPAEEPDTIATADAKTTATEADANGAAPPGGGKEAPSGIDVQAYIGRQLRAVYDDVAKQPIPERFLALMKQLEEQAPKR